MKISNIALCIVAVILSVTPSGLAQRMPQDNWYYAGEFGGGVAEGYFNYPTAVAVGTDGRVVVADRNNCMVQVYDAGGTLIAKWGSSGTGEGQFSGLQGISCDSSNYVYTVEDGADRVQVFSPDGTFVREWGSNGSGTNQLREPYGIDVGTNGLVYVADYNNRRIQVFDKTGGSITNWSVASQSPRDIHMGPDGNLYVVCNDNKVHVYSTSGTELTSWGSYGSGPGQFNQPCGVDVATNGNVYVADRNNHRIQVFSSAGSWITSWGTNGAADGEFTYPEGIAVGPDGKVYVADRDNDRIQAFDATGTHLSTLGTEGSTSDIFHPMDVAIGTNGLLYVTTSLRVQVFEQDGTFVEMWGTLGAAPGQFDRPLGIAVAPDGNIYIADDDDNEIKVFDHAGHFIREWGSYGTSDGQFSSPCDVAVDTNGLIYVMDAGNDRVQVFQPDGTFVRKWGQAGAAPSDFGNCKSIAVGPDDLVYVTDYFGNENTKVFKPDGTFVRYWDGPRDHVYVGSDGIVYTKRGTSIYVSLPEGTLLKYFYSDSYNDLTVSDSGTIFVCDEDDENIKIYRRTYRTTGEATPDVPPQPVVLSSSQRPGTTWMDVDYKVIDTDSSNVTVAALAFVDGVNSLDNVLRLNTLKEGTGANLGDGVPANETRRLTWNVAADWATEIGQAKVRVMANDGRDMIDFHFIKIPSNGPNPELTISQSPVLQSDLLPCWYWLIATNDPSINLVNGNIFGVGGAYDGAILYSGNSRPASQTEVEPNDSTGAANAVNFTNGWAGINGTLDGNYDYYALGTLSPNDTVNFRFLSSSIGETARAVLRVYEGTVQKANSSYFNDGSWSYTATSSAPHFVQVGQYEAGNYILEIGLNETASGTTAYGRTFLFDRMNVQEASQADLDLAREAATPGTINVWTPRIQVGPNERPMNINEYGFDTGDWGSEAWWVKPKP